MYNAIARVNDRLAAAKYWKYWQVRKNARTKYVALSKWKEAEKLSSSADTALMKILARIDELVSDVHMFKLNFK
jgi:transcription initiation factor TFIIIB Brf1 subunit/transcription initiation factor TFIIB